VSAAPRFALAAPWLCDGVREHAGAALIVAGGRVADIVARDALPPGIPCEDFDDELIAPGFVDLQVNGGGGVMLNDAPTVETMARIAAAHAAFGTTSILPTLITDCDSATEAVIAAAQAAVAEGVAGIAGLHLEGPHLDPAKAGAHDPASIRPMGAADIDRLCDAAAKLPVLMVTLAPGAATPAQIARLAAAGATVSLGHSAAGFDAARSAAEAGASCVTHLFNAMSQVTARDPGLAGAALALPGLSAGLIADGIHVHPAVMAAALRAKAGPGEIFLVTDAMATVGSGITGFRLNGRRVLRSGGRLTLEDGTLAGADLDMLRAIRTVMAAAGLSLVEAVRRATAAPARAVGQGGRLGLLRPGGPADAVWIAPDAAACRTWQRGRAIG